MSLRPYRLWGTPGSSASSAGGGGGSAPKKIRIGNKGIGTPKGKKKQLALAVQTVLGTGDSLYFRFNGTDQYATIPAWSPLGHPFHIGVNFTPTNVDGVRATVIAAASDYNLDILTTDVIEQSWQGVNADHLDALGSVTEDEAVNFTFDADGRITDVVGVSTVQTADSDKNILRPAISVIGSKTTPGAYFEGEIWGLTLTDNSPIQNVDTIPGDGVNYLTLNTDITITGDFTIEWDEIVAKGISRGICGNDTGSSRVRSEQIVNAVLLRTSGDDASIVNHYEGVANGQHVHVKISRTGSTARAELDRWLNPVGNSAAGDFHMQRIYSYGAGSGSIMPTGGVVQNLVVTDLAGDRQWIWKLDEPTGAVAVNTGKTQDADYDATWLSNPSRTWVPNNSRYYPMNEGSGTTFNDIIGGNDGTIVNFAGGDWPVFSIAGDAFWGDVIAYYRFNEAVGSPASFADESAAGHGDIGVGVGSTIYGSPTTTLTNAHEGNAIYFNGTQGLSIPTAVTAAWKLFEPFTLEFTLTIPSGALPSYRVVGASFLSNSGLLIYFSTNHTLKFNGYEGTGTQAIHIEMGAEMVRDTPTTMCVARDASGLWTTWSDGIVQQQVQETAPCGSNHSQFRLGHDVGSLNDSKQYLDEFRLTLADRYEGANYTPQVGAFAIP